jgi:hypothetical protein
MRHLKTILQHYVNETKLLATQTHPYGHPVNHVVMTGWTLLILAGIGCGLWRCRVMYKKLEGRTAQTGWGLSRIIHRPTLRRTREETVESAPGIELALQERPNPSDRFIDVVAPVRGRPVTDEL